MHYTISAISTIFVLIASDALAQKPATTAPAIDLEPAVFQPLPPKSKDWNRDEWLNQKYVFCYSPSSTQVWTRVPKLEVSTPDTVSCTAPLQDGAPAIAAGKRVIIIVAWPMFDASGKDEPCPNASPSEVTLMTISIPPTDPYPVRGAPAVSATQANGNTKNFLEEYSPNKLTAVPAAAATKACYLLMPGGLAADTLNTYNITMPQPPGWPASNTIVDNITKIHTYYRFGVSTAVVLNNIRTNTYAYTSGSTPASGTTPANFKYDTTTSVRTVDPVLFLTWYPVAVDTETKVKWNDPAHYDYGVVFGLSEKAPTTNYYLGLSVEPVRNIAIVVGASVISVARLTSGTYDPGPSAMHSAPSTTNVFKVGAFVGISFNFSNFLTSTIFK